MLGGQLRGVLGLGDGLSEAGIVLGELAGLAGEVGGLLAERVGALGLGGDGGEQPDALAVDAGRGGLLLRSGLAALVELLQDLRPLLARGGEAALGLGEGLAGG